MTKILLPVLALLTLSLRLQRQRLSQYQEAQETNGGNPAPVVAKTTTTPAAAPANNPPNAAATTTKKTTTTTKKRTTTTEDPWTADKINSQVDAIIQNCTTSTGKTICSTQYSDVKGATSRTDRCQHITKLQACIESSCSYTYDSTTKTLDAYCGCSFLQTTSMVVLLLTTTLSYLLGN